MPILLQNSKSSLIVLSNDVSFVCKIFSEGAWNDKKLLLKTCRTVIYVHQCILPYEFQQRSLSISSLHLFFVSFLWSNLKVQNRWQVINHFSSKTAIFKSPEKCLKIKSFIDSYLSWWEQLLNGLPTFLPPRRHPFKQTKAILAGD